MISCIPSEKIAWLTCVNARKTASLTQPGRGIRKIIDLYHDLPNLVDKAKKHTANSMLNAKQMDAIDSINLEGLTEDEIEEEHKE